MSLRRNRRRLAAVAATLTVVVSGCGTNLHPGAAAVVNGRTISQAQVEDLVQAACAYIKAQRLSTGGTQALTAVNGLRFSIVGSLITMQLNGEAVRSLNLTVSKAVVAKATEGQTIPDTIPEPEHSRLVQFFSDSTRAEIEQALLGAHAKNPSVRNADHVTPQTKTAGAAFLHTFDQRQDVVVNPAFGTWTGTQVTNTSGSLSDPVSPAAKSLLLARGNGSAGADVPASERCG